MLTKTQVRIPFGSPIHSPRHFIHRNPKFKPVNTEKSLTLNSAAAALIPGTKVASAADSDLVSRFTGTNPVPTTAAAAAAISSCKTSAACIPGTFPGLRTAPSSKPPDLHTHTVSTPPGSQPYASTQGNQPTQILRFQKLEDDRMSVTFKMLTDLAKLYVNDDLKFGGEFYDVLNQKVKIYKSFYRMAEIPAKGYHEVYSIMLKGKARDFYYYYIDSQNLTFLEIIARTYIYFYTPENYQFYINE
jgi:hypothetical protein